MLTHIWEIADAGEKARMIIKWRDTENAMRWESERIPLCPDVDLQRKGVREWAVSAMAGKWWFLFTCQLSHSDK